MKKCFIESLLGNINDNGIKFGELRINCSTSRCGRTVNASDRTFFLWSLQPITITAEGKEFTVGGQPYTTYTGNGNAAFVFPDGEYNISIMPKYNIYMFANHDTTTASKFFMIDLSQMCSDIYLLDIGRLSSFGNIKNVKNCATIILSSATNETEVDNSIDLEELVENTVLQSLIGISGKTEVTGNIESIISPAIRQVWIENQNVNGNLNTMLNNLIQVSSRTSGTLELKAKGSNILFNSNPISVTTLNFKFGTSMVNPTAEDTSRGWQVV